MNDDRDVCLCFHVSKRKLVKFLRIENPRRASQLSECGGAGTGCGWCRRFLEQLFDAHQAQLSGEPNESLDALSPEEYARQRKAYIADQKRVSDDQRP